MTTSYIGQQTLQGNDYSRLKLPNELLFLGSGSIGNSSLVELTFNNKSKHIGLSATYFHKAPQLNVPSSVKVIECHGLCFPNADTSAFRYTFNNLNALLGVEAFSPNAVKKLKKHQINWCFLLFLRFKIFYFFL